MIGMKSQPVSLSWSDNVRGQKPSPARMVGANSGCVPSRLGRNLPGSNPVGMVLAIRCVQYQSRIGVSEAIAHANYH